MNNAYIDITGVLVLVSSNDIHGTASDDGLIIQKIFPAMNNCRSCGAIPYATLISNASVFVEYLFSNDPRILWIKKRY